MSLNKLRSYEKYSIVNGELKANKLGLITATNNKCCFISNTGDKEIIARDITEDDLPAQSRSYGNNVTVYQQSNDKINIVNTADAVRAIYNDTDAKGSRTFTMNNSEDGDYIQIISRGFYTTRTGQAEILRGLNLSITDTVNTQVWDLYSPPETNPRYAILFPESVNNFNQSIWDLEIKILRRAAFGSTNIKLFVRFNSQSNKGSGAGLGQGSACFTELSTTGINWDGEVTVNYSWKYGTGTQLSSSFQIYTLDTTIKKVQGIQSVI